MKYTIFETNGILDLQAITTFGISSKPNANPIGYFGTGLKYAVSILLREKQKLTLIIDKKQYDFKTVEKKFRNDTFDFIQMNRTKLPFTTELGKNWELWCAFRELFCNTLDEDGKIYESNELPVFKPGTTYFIVEGGEFNRIYENSETIFLASKPIFATKTAEIHLGESNYVYYRGIRIATLSTKSKYTYNILTSLELTEDRTAKNWYLVQNYITDVLAACDLTEVITDICTIKGYYEENVSFSYVTLGSVFNTIAIEMYKQRIPNFNTTLVQNILYQDKPELDNYIYSEAALSVIDKKRLVMALKFLNKLNYDIDYPIKVVDNLGKNVLGLAKNGTIYLSHACFLLGTKFVTATILEEYLHLKYNYYDCTRELQNFLFDTIISMGEQITNEIL